MKDVAPVNTSGLSHYHVAIEETTGIKRATACARGDTIFVNLPRYWSKADKHEIAQKLVDRIVKQCAKDDRLLRLIANDPTRISLTTQAELDTYVRKVNRDTFDIPLKAVRLGQAKFTRLAQNNVQLNVITISAYCLKNVPERALRYLVIHELAHYHEANHSKRFWNHVARFIPDYKMQSKLIKAVHKANVDAELAKEEEASTINSNTTAPSAQPDGYQPQLTPLPSPEKQRLETPALVQEKEQAHPLRQFMGQLRLF